MNKITSVASLKSAILTLQEEQYEKGQELKEQVYITIDSLRPVNLFRTALDDLFSTKDMLGSLSGTTMGVAGGFLLNKLFVGRSGNIFRKIIGTVIQFGMTNLISKNSEFLKSVGQTLWNYLFPREED
jgi:hypothetical protein